MTIDEQLLRDEGERLFPYMDCCGKPWRECVCKDKGKLTVGCGRNLDDNGISHIESEFMKSRDIMRIEGQIQETWPWTQSLDDARRGVLVNMGFNMGIHRLSEFTGFLALMQAGSWEAAAADLGETKVAKQLVKRYKRLAQQIRSGEWQ